MTIMYKTSDSLVAHRLELLALQSFFGDGLGALALLALRVQHKLLLVIEDASIGGANFV